MLALIAALIRAAEQALRIWAVNAGYNLQRRIEADIATDEAQIEIYRRSSSDELQRAADRLRERILRAHGIAATLPAPSAPAQGGPADPDASRNLHPANG